MSRDPRSTLRSKPTLMKLSSVEDRSTAPGPAVPPSPPVSVPSESPGPVGASGAGVGFIFEIPEGKPPLITKITPGGPAEASGFVKVGDSIVEIDGKSALGLTTKQVSMLVVGMAGSIVRFKLHSADGTIKTASLTRRKITPMSAALSSAAGMIKEAFSSPAYKPAKKRQSAVSNFDETYRRESMNTSLSDASFTASGGATDVPSQDPLGRVPQQSSQLSHPAPSARECVAAAIGGRSEASCRACARRARIAAGAAGCWSAHDATDSSSHTADATSCPHAAADRSRTNAADFAGRCSPACGAADVSAEAARRNRSMQLSIQRALLLAGRPE